MSRPLPGGVFSLSRVIHRTAFRCRVLGVAASLVAMGSFLEIGDKVASMVGALCGFLALIVALLAWLRPREPVRTGRSEGAQRLPRRSFLDRVTFAWNGKITLSLLLVAVSLAAYAFFAFSLPAEPSGKMLLNVLLILFGSAASGFLAYKAVREKAGSWNPADFPALARVILTFSALGVGMGLMLFAMLATYE